MCREELKNLETDRRETGQTILTFNLGIMLEIVHPYPNSMIGRRYGRKLPVSFLRREAAFTLVEVLIAVGVLGVVIASLYGGFVYAFSQIALVQQNIRATQILEEKTEVIRLVNWDQLVNQSRFVPTNFTAPFYAANPTNPGANSFTYTGTVQITSAPVTESYAPSLRMIQVTLSWTSGNVARQRQMTTFVSQYGMQNYAY
jgi:prepilin-type N-terminal cleavage/methylation domain-containing protein